MSNPRVLVSFRNAAKAEPYFAALRIVGLDPAGCTPGPHAGIDGVKAILLTGGGDVVPEYYGQAPEPELDGTDRERDAFELGLLTIADAANIPTLAICRGMQLLNVHRGGTLIQHLPQSARHQGVHAVRVESGSKLASILGADEAQVNSRHHQAIDQVGAGLTVTARDTDDGVIEAVEDPTRRFLVGVQWHPEDLAAQDEVQRRIFEAFARVL
jgi:putative glutamine amidotransferase